MLELGGMVLVVLNFVYEMVVCCVDVEGFDFLCWCVVFDGVELVYGWILCCFGECFVFVGFCVSLFCLVYGFVEVMFVVIVVLLGEGVCLVCVDCELFVYGCVCWSEFGDVWELVSFGVLVFGMLIEVFDCDGCVLFEVYVGEIVVCSFLLMSGYYCDDEEIVCVFGEGRLCIGDFGFVIGGELYVFGWVCVLII